MQVWQPNQQLENGKYIIEQYLGRGGFGITYIARQQPSGKLVAIKTLNPIAQNQADFPQQQVKFVKEAMRLTKFNHPHIVQVYELIEHQGLWGMVMEYIEGENLAAYIMSHGVMTEGQALPIIQQVGEALTFVHQQGFLHRDVKPDNIILRRDTLKPVLIDFGLAREFNFGEVQSLTNAITPHYAPIEQYQRRGVFGDYTDVYALAATLYFLLTKELPFPAHIRASNVPLVPPKQHNSRITDRVNNAILKGMALEPKDRPQSVQEWLNLLISQKQNVPIIRIPPPVAVLKPTVPDIKLVSAVGMDYRPLQKLLAAKEWQAADQETGRVMLAVAKREKEGWLDSESIEKFPREDLRTIDQLWVQYSDGRFGLSVQRKIYHEVGKDYQKFGDRIGWRVNNNWLNYDKLTFSTNAPSGHLPLTEVVRDI